jgi:hypothetical protein
MKLAPRSSGRSRKRRGILTFEWILLISLLVIGVIGGLTAVRNSLICELNELTGCIEAIACCDNSPPAPPAPGDGSSGQGCSGGCGSCGNGGSQGGGGWWHHHGGDHWWGD